MARSGATASGDQVENCAFSRQVNNVDSYNYETRKGRFYVNNGSGGGQSLGQYRGERGTAVRGLRTPGRGRGGRQTSNFFSKNQNFAQQQSGRAPAASCGKVNVVAELPQGKATSHSALVRELKGCSVIDDLGDASPRTINWVESLHAVLEYYNFNRRDVLALLQRNGYEEESIQREVERVVEDSKGHEQGSWETVMSKRQQQLVKQQVEAPQRLSVPSSRQQKANQTRRRHPTASASRSHGQRMPRRRDVDRGIEEPNIKDGRSEPQAPDVGESENIYATLENDGVVAVNSVEELPVEVSSESFRPPTQKSWAARLVGNTEISRPSMSGRGAYARPQVPSLGIELPKPSTSVLVKGNGDLGNAQAPKTPLLSPDSSPVMSSCRQQEKTSKIVLKEIPCSPKMREGNGSGTRPVNWENSPCISPIASPCRSRVHSPAVQPRNVAEMKGPVKVEAESVDPCSSEQHSEVKDLPPVVMPVRESQGISFGTLGGKDFVFGSLTAFGAFGASDEENMEPIVDGSSASIAGTGNVNDNDGPSSPTQVVAVRPSLQSTERDGAVFDSTSTPSTYVSATLTAADNMAASTSESRNAAAQTEVMGVVEDQPLDHQDYEQPQSQQQQHVQSHGHQHRQAHERGHQRRQQYHSSQQQFLQPYSQTQQQQAQQTQGSGMSSPAWASISGDTSGAFSRSVGPDVNAARPPPPPPSGNMDSKRQQRDESNLQKSGQHHFQKNAATSSGAQQQPQAAAAYNSNHPFSPPPGLAPNIAGQPTAAAAYTFPNYHGLTTYPQFNGVYFGHGNIMPPYGIMGNPYGAKGGPGGLPGGYMPGYPNLPYPHQDTFDESGSGAATAGSPNDMYTPLTGANSSVTAHGSSSGGSGGPTATSSGSGGVGAVSMPQASIGSTSGHQHSGPNASVNSSSAGTSSFYNQGMNAGSAANSTSSSGGAVPPGFAQSYQQQQHMKGGLQPASAGVGGSSGYYYSGNNSGTGSGSSTAFGSRSGGSAIDHHAQIQGQSQGQASHKNGSFRPHFVGGYHRNNTNAGEHQQAAVAAAAGGYYTNYNYNQYAQPPGLSNNYYQASYQQQNQSTYSGQRQSYGNYSNPSMWS